MQKVKKITPFIWFKEGAEEAIKFYVSVFVGAGEEAEILGVTYYPKVAENVSGKPAGSVMTVSFRLAGQDFVAINGGEPFKLTEAFSLVINCETQKEIDYYWEKLKVDGDEKSQICGWLKDKFGLSWQIGPANIEEMLRDPGRAERVMSAVLKMKKINLMELQKAYDGK